MPLKIFSDMFCAFYAYLFQVKEHYTLELNYDACCRLEIGPQLTIYPPSIIRVSAHIDQSNGRNLMTHIAFLNPCHSDGQHFPRYRKREVLISRWRGTVIQSVGNNLCACISHFNWYIILQKHTRILGTGFAGRCLQSILVKWNKSLEWLHSCICHS